MLLGARLDQLPVLRNNCHNCLVSLVLALFTNLDLPSAIILPICLVTGNAKSTLPRRNNIALSKNNFNIRCNVRWVSFPDSNSTVTNYLIKCIVHCKVLSKSAKA